MKVTIAPVLATFGLALLVCISGAQATGETTIKFHENAKQLFDSGTVLSATLTIEYVVTDKAGKPVQPILFFEEYKNPVRFEFEQSAVNESVTCFRLKHPQSIYVQGLHGWLKGLSLHKKSGYQWEFPEADKNFCRAKVDLTPRR